MVLTAQCLIVQTNAQTTVFAITEHVSATINGRVKIAPSMSNLALTIVLDMEFVPKPRANAFVMRSTQAFHVSNGSLQLMDQILILAETIVQEMVSVSIN